MSPELATMMNAAVIAYTIGDHGCLLTMAWIALPLAVVVRNSAKFRLWFIQITLARHAHPALKRNLAIPSAAHKIVSFLSMISQLTSASLLSFVLQNVILVSAQGKELLSHQLPVVVRPALL
jgi:hypothetical protein